jgi:sulfate transport system ATP-binding protein
VEFNRWQPKRGDRCYAVPDFGHLFDAHQGQPRTLSWLKD